MRVHFWGVRGSMPTPILPNQIQSKIAAVVQRVEPKDLVSPEAREAFLANLPPYLTGTIGGNSTCVEVRLDDDTVIIIDAGSGIAPLGNSLKKRREHVRHYHLFFTHFHWDHIQGLPFFTPVVYDPRCKITFHSPIEGFEGFLREQMRYPYFPITMEAMNADLRFEVLTGEPVTINGATIDYREVKHPGRAFSYKFTENRKSFIFSTDTELTEDDFRKNVPNREFYEGVDTIVMDSQYTLDEAIEKYDWGHSSYSLAVDFASEWGIEKLVLYHHEPLYDDKKMHAILKSSQWYASHLEGKKLKIMLASEDLDLII